MRFWESVSPDLSSMTERNPARPFLFLLHAFNSQIRLMPLETAPGAFLACLEGPFTVSPLSTL